MFRVATDGDVQQLREIVEQTTDKHKKKGEQRLSIENPNGKSTQGISSETGRTALLWGRDDNSLNIYQLSRTDRESHNSIGGYIM